MKKQLINLCVNTVILLGCVGIVINLSPFLQTPASSVGSFLLKSSYPQLFLADYKEKTTTHNDTDTANNTTTQSQQVESVMNGIGVEDSKNDSPITATPDDIAKLMEDARNSFDQSQTTGKTSEEAYFGGGTLVTLDKVEVQSKIPESFYQLDIDKLLKQGADLTIADKSQPTILVYHSHATESYSLLDTGFYIDSDSRCQETTRNMVRVGEELVSYLEKAGFVVLHDKTIHDTSYNSAYSSSKASVEKYLEEYPSIEITIDVHRDTITYSDGTKVKPTVEIDGKKAAKLMLIAGCEYGSVKNYPDWEYNLRFDLAVQNKLSEKYPQLMRPILFSQRKYNMNLTHNSFLLEVGTDANTLDEACYSARLFGEALGELLNEEYVE